MKPLKAAHHLWGLVTALEVNLMRSELIYALPLVSYMLLIALLFAYLLPAAWKNTRSRLNVRKKWRVGSYNLDGELLSAQNGNCLFQEGDAIKKVPLDLLPREDRVIIEADNGLLGHFQHPRIFFALAFVSFGVTWTYMLQYFALSLATYATAHVTKRIALSPLSAINIVRKPEDLQLMPLLWLRDVSLFDEVRLTLCVWVTIEDAQAWSTVCAEPARWLLSSQLCLFAVVAFTPMVTTSKFRRRWQGGTVLVLGQIVAISVATGLTLRLPSKAATHISVLIWPSLIFATMLTGFLPKLSGTHAFLPVLLALHALLFAPLLPVLKWPRNKLRLDYLYFALAVLASLIHLEALVAVQHPLAKATMEDIFNGLARPEWTAETAVSTYRAMRDAFLAHPAQASIGSDALLCAVIFFASRATDRSATLFKWLLPLLLAVTTPFVGLGCVSAVYLAMCERSVVEEVAMLS